MLRSPQTGTRGAHSQHQQRQQRQAAMKLPPTHAPSSEHGQAAAPVRFGERLMQTMGWNKGQGLGKDGKGIKAAIRAKKKDGQEGVGAGKVNAWDWSNDWWEKAFNQKASKLQEVRAQASDDSSASAGTQQLESGTDDAQVAEQPLPVRPSASTAGRDRWTGFRSRAGTLHYCQLVASAAVPQCPSAAGKLARVARQEALKAAQPAAAQPAAAQPQMPAAMQPAAQSQDQPEAAAPRTKRKLAKAAAAAAAAEQPAQQPAAAQEPQPQPEPEPEQAPRPLPQQPSGWWGHTRFVSSGWMGSLGEERQLDKAGFTEDQQAGLHQRLTQLKSSGKSGLGTGRSASAGGMKAKAGERWAGNKVSFDDDAEAAPGEPSAAAETVQPLDSTAPVKWKKLCSSILQETPNGSMKLGKLERRFLQRLQEHSGLAVADAWRQQSLLQPKVAASSRFRLEGGRVTLSAAG